MTVVIPAGVDRGEVTRVLEDATSLMERVGWTTGEQGIPPGPICLEGAVRWAGHKLGYAWCTDVLQASLDALATVIAGEPSASGFTCITVDWNDYVCPNQHEALEMLRRTAKEVANG